MDVVLEQPRPEDLSRLGVDGYYYTLLLPKPISIQHRRDPWASTLYTRMRVSRKDWRFPKKNWPQQLKLKPGHLQGTEADKGPIFNVKFYGNAQHAKIEIQLLHDIFGAAIRMTGIEKLHDAFYHREFMDIFELLWYCDALKSQLEVLESLNYATDELKPLRILLFYFVPRARILDLSPLCMQESLRILTGSLVYRYSGYEKRGFKCDIRRIGDVTYAEMERYPPRSISHAWPHLRRAPTAPTQFTHQDVEITERLRMTEALSIEVVNIHKQIRALQEQRALSLHSSMFVDFLGGPSRSFRTGLKTLQEIVSGNRPQDLRTLFSCVMVAKAMQTALARYPDLAPDVTDERFLEDLSRWFSLVPDSAKGIFTELTGVLWGWTLNLDPASLVDSDMLGEDCDLIKSLGMLASLISNTADRMHQDDILDLEVAQRRSIEAFSGHTDHNSLHRPPAYETFDTRDIDSNIIIETDAPNAGTTIDSAQFPNPWLFLVLMGAIFTAILIFILAWNYGRSAVAEATLSGIHGMWNLDGYLKPRGTCFYAMVYVSILKETFDRPPAGNQEAAIVSNSEVSGNDTPATLHRTPEEMLWPQPVTLLDDIVVPQQPADDTYDTSSDNVWLSQWSILSNTNISPARASSDVMISPDPSPATKYPCSLCGKTFGTISNRNRHEKRDCQKLVGKESAKFRCDKCAKEVTRVHYLNNGHAKRCRGGRKA